MLFLADTPMLTTTAHPDIHVLHIQEPFALENGEVLHELEIGFSTFGKLNEAKDNVVWVFHALTANSQPLEWWPGLVGSGKWINPDHHFIVCANMLGSCYGSSGPLSIDLRKGKPYGKDFPLVTVRDMVRAHQLLASYLGIEKIWLGIGGSMGGQQAMEWAIASPDVFENLALIATNARHSAWGIAFNEAQRMAIKAGLISGSEEGARAGLEAARAIGMLSYRSYKGFVLTQTDPEPKLDHLKAASYQKYQGLKLSKRFDLHSYIRLTKAMDSHHVGRHRESITAALQQITANTLVIGIKSDFLFPVEEQQLLAQNIPGAQLAVIESDFGHDGFLIEFDTLEQLLKAWIHFEPIQDAAGKVNQKNVKQTLPIVVSSALPGTEGF